MVIVCKLKLRIVIVYDSICVVVIYVLKLFWKFYFIKFLSKYIFYVCLKLISKWLNVVELNDFLEIMGLI